MRIAVLAGGLGTRLSEETGVRPKPMVDIGGRPILWHIMKGYSTFGLRDFVVALGYKGDQIKDFFMSYSHSAARSMHIETRTGRITDESGDHDDWNVHLVETGLTTNTGGRVLRLRDWLTDEQFCLSYGDGVADVDVKRLIEYHQSHGKLATITAVRPPSRFGGLVLDDGLVTEFVEKPQIGEGCINGGFMVLDRRVLERIAGDDTSFEADVLEELARDGQLMAWMPISRSEDGGGDFPDSRASRIAQDEEASARQPRCVADSSSLNFVWTIPGASVQGAAPSCERSVDRSCFVLADQVVVEMGRRETAPDAIPPLQKCRRGL